MVETIPDLTYGTVTGRFLAAVADSTDDADAHPDGVPLSGTVTFTPSAKVILIPGVGTILPVTIEATLDAEGYISLNGSRGLELIASDSPVVNPNGFTYAVAFKSLRYGATNSITYPPFNISVPGGVTTDLSEVAPVPSSGGVAIVRGEPGLSAYDVAVNNGYAGTEAQWLASLQGPAGDSNVAVLSVAGRIGDVVLSKADVGLNNVNNTADANKPVSSAQQSALDGKAPVSHTHTASQISDASIVGRALLTAVDQANARNALAAASWSTGISAGTGLTGGGDLTTSRTLSLSPASVASLTKADTLTTALGDTTRLAAISKNLSGTDLNDWKQNGWGAGNALTNSPDGSTAFFYVRNHANTAADNYFQQTAVKYGLGGNSGDTWARYAEGQGVYTPWVKVADTQGALDAGARAILPTKITKGQQAIVYADIDPAIAAAINNGAVAYNSLSSYVKTVNGTGPDANGNVAVVASGGTSAVTTVAGRTGDVVLTKTDVGLANVDNTADTAKPVSTAQQTALNGKVSIATASNSTVYGKDGTGVQIGLGFAQSALPGNLAQRDANGMITVGTVVGNLGAAQAAPRQYVDDRAGDMNPATAVSPGATSYALTATASRTLRVSLTANATFTIAASTSGVSFTQTLVLVQDATGSRTVTWPSTVKWDSVTKPTLSTAANAIDIVTLLWTGTEWIGFLGAKGVA